MILSCHIIPPNFFSTRNCKSMAGWTVVNCRCSLSKANLSCQEHHHGNQVPLLHNKSQGLVTDSVRFQTALVP